MQLTWNDSLHEFASLRIREIVLLENQSMSWVNEMKVSQKVLGMGSGTLFLHKLEQVPTI